MDIRAATTGDAAAAQAIAILAYAPYLPRMDRRPAPMDADFEAAALDGSLKVLSDGAEVVGYIVSFPDGADWQVENLAIAPTAQGRGCGRLLVAEAARLAQAAGCAAITLYTNVAMTEAAEFYIRTGFEEIGRQRDHGFDRIYFRLPLEP